MKFKKGLAVLLAATTMLSGCGASESTSKEADSNAEVASNSEENADVSANEAENVTTGSGEKVVIEYWHCNAETQGGLTVDELVENFNATNDHIEVVAKYNPDMYKGLMQNLQAETAAGNTPALVQIGWAFVDYFSNNFSYVTPQDAIDQYDAEDATFLEDNFLPNIRRICFQYLGLYNQVLNINPLSKYMAFQTL